MAGDLRVDLFLKMSRLIKRRSLAKEICDAGCVQINGRVAKAGTLVQVDDVLTMDIRDRLLRVRVLRIPQRIEGPEGVVEVLPGEVEE
ncbi:RNA-binding S4 domain-containing protein [Acidithiobacillus sp. 'AMD consortium']|uniref:RNA-binding S4 domain-containing protein n=2 Tax=Acidithiobacillus ferridurans TaxID=1232575 RepID=A0A8X8KAM5_ACIFI|nr:MULTISPECIES: S4 domain-containing protein [Acidithiobacillus]MBU2715654.1 RNA-binding S4 domain-containing protein [Acidithiobacillus ferridurans]MBU2722252.1 RNA-binding S4 domain-containing protein [Acidithiobacillus ferridurans]MBU2727015.1 RNA-binding S4 domain-containing protein [Acidithiobacillus ferridurans]MBU2732134.1 RNA-binding S4 domain-containing protein [Acidithiobacillus ferridurans]QFG77388.1 RNA-binding S4 domain-containing protein [Acidithiobacillus sp. 'AMD consortium']